MPSATSELWLDDSIRSGEMFQGQATIGGGGDQWLVAKADHDAVINRRQSMQSHTQGIGHFTLTCQVPDDRNREALKAVCKRLVSLAQNHKNFVRFGSPQRREYLLQNRSAAQRQKWLATAHPSGSACSQNYC